MWSSGERNNEKEALGISDIPVNCSYAGSLSESSEHILKCRFRELVIRHLIQWIWARN